MSNVERFEMLNTEAMKKCFNEEDVRGREIGPIESIRFGRVVLFSQCYSGEGTPYCLVFGFKMGAPVRSRNVARFTTENIPKERRKAIHKALQDQGVHGLINFLN